MLTRTCRRSKQDQHRLRERLEIIVAIYLRLIVYRDLAEDLQEENVRIDARIRFTHSRLSIDRSIDRLAHLHAYHSINEEKHYNKKGDIRQSLKGLDERP